MKRRELILLLGGASSGAMSVGTGAFSSVEAERNVEVDVVSDNEAFVGYKTLNDGTDVKKDDHITLVRITNRFGDDISIVDVQVDEGGDMLSDISYNGTIESGEQKDIKAHIGDISPGETVDIEITVTVEGSDVTAELFGDTQTRQFHIVGEERSSDIGTTSQDEGKGKAKGKGQDEGKGKAKAKGQDDIHKLG